MQTKPRGRDHAQDIYREVFQSRKLEHHFNYGPGHPEHFGARPGDPDWQN